MTEAVNSFLWGLGAFTAQTRPPRTESGIQKPPPANKIDTDSPDVFELLEIYERWFGQQERKQTETAQTVPSKGKDGGITYRFAEADKNISASDADNKSTPLREEATAQQPESIAETLAKAELALQALPDLPPQSRLKASLNALEAALSGTSLSDLEALLADNIADRNKSKCA